MSIVNRREYVLGVDGGNTKTIALVAHMDGSVVGVGRGGCGDIYSAGPESAVAEVNHAVQRALAVAGAQPTDLATGVFSMAGADWPEDFALLEQAMQRLHFGRTIAVVNDALGALRAGVPDGSGISVVCGTGIAIGAGAADGREWHGSFWLEAMGAGDLGRRTLWAVYHAELGIAPPTSLSARVLAFFGCARVEEVLHLFTGRETARPRDARQLARLLLDEAQAGDAVARQIVQAHGTRMGEYAPAAARQVGIAHTPFTLVLAGGVLRHPSPLLSETLTARVRTAAPQVQVVNSRFEPAVGALLLALEAAGVAVDAALIARLSASLPPASLFETG